MFSDFEQGQCIHADSKIWNYPCRAIPGLPQPCPTFLYVLLCKQVELPMAFVFNFQLPCTMPVPVRMRETYRFSAAMVKRLRSGEGFAQWPPHLFFRSLLTMVGDPWVCCIQSWGCAYHPMCGSTYKLPAAPLLPPFSTTAIFGLLDAPSILSSLLTSHRLAYLVNLFTPSSPTVPSFKQTFHVPALIPEQTLSLQT